MKLLTSLGALALAALSHFPRAAARPTEPRQDRRGLGKPNVSISRNSSPPPAPISRQVRRQRERLAQKGRKI